MSRPIIIQQIDDRVEIFGDVMSGPLQIGIPNPNNLAVPEAGLKVLQLDGYNILPDSFGPGMANFYVAREEIDGLQKGILHVKGNEYPGEGAWQLAGNADVESTNRLFYRQGIDFWGEWKEIAFLDSVVQGAHMLTVDNTGASNIPIYFFEGIPVASEYDLHTLIRPGETEYIPNITNIIIADKLSIDAGAPQRPIYFRDGIPMDCSPILAVDINGNANTATAFKTPITLRVALNSSSFSSLLDGMSNVHDIGVSGILPVQHGGTGTLYAAVPGGVMFGKTTSSYECSPAGSAGQLLTSGGTGSPIWLTGNIGSVNQPVYILNGVPTPCTTSLSINITGSAASATQLYINNDTSSKLYVLGATTTGNASVYRETSVYMQNNVLYGAAWNDYAEYREQLEEIEPGYCVISNNQGKISKTNYTLSPCDGIVSDTYGFAIGQTETCKIPLAVAGRVLAYCEGDRYLYCAGDPVCAGAEGKVVKMSREDVQNYPDRIVGIVSEIPEYEVWGSGNIKINGRIWIKIK